MHPIDQLLAYQLEGKQQEAWEISEQMEREGPDNCKDPSGKVNPETWIRHSFNRGWFLLQQGDYQKGCQLLENGRFISVYGSPPLKTNKPIFNPQEHDIRGKSIIISLEGGYGDEIIHARFATSFKEQGASKVYLAAAPELVGVFSRIPGVDNVILRDAADTVQHDFWVPGFSAGWVAGHTFNNFPSKPYMFPNEKSVDLWKQILNGNDKIKVGIRWAGNPKFEHQQFRKFPEQFMTNLAKYKELQVYSLQRDHNIIDLPEGITDLQHFLLSWEDTMACISNLDLVITSCTSIAHIAAAMGKETWVLPPILPYHTWAYGSPQNNKSPYYDCVTLFRQIEAGKWNNTFQKLYTALEQKFNLAHVVMPNEDKELKRLNLGCGLKKFDGYLNVDISDIVKPDQVVDLNVTPWPWKDNEFGHIVAKDVLEHLGDTDKDFLNILKEMYRISSHGAIWEIQVPHWRCDLALDDPTHKRLITMGTFLMFNRKTIFERVKRDLSDSLLAFEYDIDLEICDIQFDYLDHWLDRKKKGDLTEAELTDALNTFNNVASSMKVLIQVNKPGRVSIEELQAYIDNKNLQC
jgi:hypothetical protein